MEHQGELIEEFNELYFTNLQEVVCAEQLSETDVDILHELAPDLDLDETHLTELNAVYEVAVQQISRGSGANSPEGVHIRQSREKFFSLLNIEGQGKPLHTAMQHIRRSYRGKAPSPRQLIQNARLLHAINAPIVETMAQDRAFLVANIELNKLDTVEAIYNGYGLSIWEIPELALRNPDTVGDSLSHLALLLERLQLPLETDELVRLRPQLLQDSPAKHTILAALAHRHGNFRNYLATSHERGKLDSAHDRLARDMITATCNQVEPFIISVLDKDELHIPTARSLARQLQGARAREYLLSALSDAPEGIQKIGAPILRAYFERKPMTQDELGRYIPVAIFVLTNETSESELLPALSSEKLQIADTSWLAELMQRPLMPKEHRQLLRRLNQTLNHDTADHFGPQTEEESLREQAQTDQFFELLGWTSPDHRMYGSFSAYKTYMARTGQSMITPREVVEIARLLAEPAQGQLIDVFSVEDCYVLHVDMPTIKVRLADAISRSLYGSKPVGEIIAADRSRFVGGLTPEKFVAPELPPPRPPKAPKVTGRRPGRPSKSASSAGKASPESSQTAELLEDQKPDCKLTPAEEVAQIKSRVMGTSAESEVAPPVVLTPEQHAALQDLVLQVYETPQARTVEEFVTILPDLAQLSVAEIEEIIMQAERVIDVTGRAITISWIRNQTKRDAPTVD